MHKRVSLARNYYNMNAKPNKSEFGRMTTIANKFAKAVDALHKTNTVFHMVHGRIVVIGNMKLWERISDLYRLCVKNNIEWKSSVVGAEELVLYTDSYRAKIDLRRNI